jgi:hypothetical protein
LICPRIACLACLGNGWDIAVTRDPEIGVGRRSSIHKCVNAGIFARISKNLHGLLGCQIDVMGLSAAAGVVSRAGTACGGPSRPETRKNCLENLHIFRPATEGSARAIGPVGSAGPCSGAVHSLRGTTLTPRGNIALANMPMLVSVTNVRRGFGLSSAPSFAASLIDRTIGISMHALRAVCFRPRTVVRTTICARAFSSSSAVSFFEFLTQRRALQTAVRIGRVRARFCARSLQKHRKEESRHGDNPRIRSWLQSPGRQTCDGQRRSDGGPCGQYERTRRYFFGRCKRIYVWDTIVLHVGSGFGYK